MISVHKRFLFIHVPKTGGNSIQNILRNYSEDEIVTLAKHQDGIERFEVRNSKYNTTKHSTLSHYKSALDSKTYHSLFKFATIRNPWDMMISYYFSPHRAVEEWDRGDFVALVDRVPTLRHFICERSFSENSLEKIGVKTKKQKLGKNIDFLIPIRLLKPVFLEED
ncbi:MAG: sulfotransferase family 2 domain-containing protein, partial [Cycloclasticus sp.]